MKPDIDPVAVLDAHQKARNTGMRMVSVLVGPPSQSRAVFGSWIRQSVDARTVVVAPEPTYDAAKRALNFAGAETVLQFVPSRDHVACAAAAAMHVADEDRVRPLALVIDFLSFEVLMKDINVPAAIRHAAFGGLVPLQHSVVTKLNALDPSPMPPRPYRSHHEYVLHTLMIHDPAIQASFEANSRVFGASRKTYEVDLWCSALKFAVEVDGTDHVTSTKQKGLDVKRDADLAKVGVKTVRVLASAVMSDPTRTLKLVRDEILSRSKETVR